MSHTIAPFPDKSAYPWVASPSFGPMLRHHRQEMGLTLHEAATVLGVSYGGLGKIERAERTGRPSFEFLRLAADLFGLKFEDACIEAGYEDWPEPVYEEDGAVQIQDPIYRKTRCSPVSLEEEFYRIVFAPELCPSAIEPDHMDFFSERVMVGWLQFAFKLEKHLKRGGLALDVLLRRPTSLGEAEEEEADEPALLLSDTSTSGPAAADEAVGHDLEAQS